MTRFTLRKSGDRMATLRPKINIGRFELQLGAYRNPLGEKLTSRKNMLAVALDTQLRYGTEDMHDDVDIDSEDWLEAGKLVDKLFPELNVTEV